MTKDIFSRNTKEKGLHDKGFHEIVTQTGLFVDLVKLALGETRQDMFDWDTASLTDPRIVDDQNRKLRIDLKFTVNLKSGGAQFEVVMIFEHKSYTDPKLMKQLLRYQSAHYLNFDQPVLVIVIFQRGGGKFDRITTFQQSLGWGNEEAKGILIKHFGEVLLNFGRLDLNFPKLIKEDVRMDAAVDLVVHTMGNIFHFNRKIFKEFFRKAQRVRGTAYHQVIMKLLGYIIRNYKEITVKVMAEIENQVVPEEELRVIPEYSEYYHTPLVDKEAEVLAEVLAEVRAEVLVEEKIKCERERIAHSMLDRDFDIDTVSELTELSREEVEAIRDQNSD